MMAFIEDEIELRAPLAAAVTFLTLLTDLSSSEAIVLL